MDLASVDVGAFPAARTLAPEGDRLGFALHARRAQQPGVRLIMCVVTGCSACLVQRADPQIGLLRRGT